MAEITVEDKAMAIMIKVMGKVLFSSCSLGPYCPLQIESEINEQVVEANFFLDLHELKLAFVEE